MQCPSCEHPYYNPAQPCPVCVFEGDPALIEELGHIVWLLNELETRQDLGLSHPDRQKLQERYQLRRYELEIELGLRFPSLTAAEAEKAWPELSHREVLLARIPAWLQAGFLLESPAQTLRAQLEAQIREYRLRLEPFLKPDYPQTNADYLAQTDFLLEAIGYLGENEGFTSLQTEMRLRTPLLAEKKRLQTKLGLAPAKIVLPVEAEIEPEIEAAPVPTKTQTVAQAIPAETKVSLPPPKHKLPAAPLQDRLWGMLLSERTLQALLFLGIFLLFAAAISFVLLGWQNFSAPMRVAIPVGFTALFFGLGRYIRFKTNLHRSGIALSAIAALLVPIDFWAVYANFNIPVDWQAIFWLVASLLSLGAYILATLVIRSRLFGYLVATAAGSSVLALVEVAHQFTGLSLDWRSASLSALAAGLIGIAALLERNATQSTTETDEKTWPRYFVQPFRYVALLAAGVLMPLSFGYRTIDRPTFDTLHTSMTVSWWLGGFIFGWGAVHYRSRSFGLLAAFSLPVAVYFTQSAIFDNLDINPAWHAFGLAWLVPLYFWVGRTLLRRDDDSVLRGHGQTATGWGVALLLISALWSLTDLGSGAAAAASHAVLAGAMIPATILWGRPRYLFGASLFALTASTFALTQAGLSLAQLTPGWAALALLHIFIALYLGRKHTNFASPPVIAGYIIAALALLPPLVFNDTHTLNYGLGNWLALAGWGAWLAHQKQPGFAPKSNRQTALFHWFAALPLPVWLWLLFTNARPADFSLALALAALAWGMAALSYTLKSLRFGYHHPWILTALITSVVAPILAFQVDDLGLAPALTLLAAGLLYLADAFISRRAAMQIPGGLVTAWGFTLLLNRLNVFPDAIIFSVAALVSLYFLTGLWLERRKSKIYTAQFLSPLYLTAHLLTFLLLIGVYSPPLNSFFGGDAWTDAMKAWGSATQLLLGVVYGLFAWGRYQERWGHVAAWLGAAGGGFIAIAFSRGHGSSAAKGALVAVAYVLAERALRGWWRGSRGGRRLRAMTRLAWYLYRRPLLVAGWSASVAIILLALIRNLVLLDAGPTQKFWAWLGLLIITGLYALSARLFRQVRFVWLASALLFAPWTILTNLGWYTAYRPTVPGYALSWVALAWLLFLLHLLIRRNVGRNYAIPANVVAQALLVFALLWGVADMPTSRFTVGLAIGLYALGAILTHHRYKTEDAPLKRTVFLYPTLALLPVWSVYLMIWLLPTARHEHFGLMLLVFAPWGLIGGEWLRRIGGELGSRYALPAHLAGFGSMIVATMLVAHLPALLALVLIFDVLILLAAARLFQNPLWTYPAGVLIPISMLIALSQRGIPANRQGWWLIGLAAIYLLLAWLLRRSKLPGYDTAALTIGLALIALGLPPSSRDRIGALWGYGGATLLYALTAWQLRQPLLLVPACALIVVPLAMGLQLSTVPPRFYGLALFGGAIPALALGWLLDTRLGRRREFPWYRPEKWGGALGARLFDWWALPLYALGFGLAAAAPFFTRGRNDLSALNFLLLAGIFGWAIIRFRLRGWLLAAGLSIHAAGFAWLAHLGWWQYPEHAWLRFMPVTIITTITAMLLQQRFAEKSPLEKERFWLGWSRPLYALAAFDLFFGQLYSLTDTQAGALVTLAHTLILIALASFWATRWLTYGATVLGAVALLQWAFAELGQAHGLPPLLALLSLGYGLAGFAISLYRRHLPDHLELRAGLGVWENPLRNSGIVLSLWTLALTTILGLNIIEWTVRAIFGYPFRQIVELPVALMAVRVPAILGLLYLTEASARRMARLGYGAVAMLLAAWSIYAFYVQQWAGSARVQWYAIPAGLYLLVVAWLEWRRGNKRLARWIDYAAMLLMLGTLFWQTLLFGWAYFLLMATEGLAAVLYGSARRLRRFLYGGVAGVALAAASWFINAFNSINQWLAFGIIGLLIIGGAVAVERKLDELKALQDTLDTWE